MKRSEGKQTPEELLASRLKPGERILWKGRPVERSWTGWDTGKLLFGSALFSLCAAFFLMLPTFLSLCFDARMKYYRFPSVLGILLAALIITPLLVSSLYLLTSPWRKRTTRRNTRYVFTDQRLLTIVRETPLFSPPHKSSASTLIPFLGEGASGHIHARMVPGMLFWSTGKEVVL